MPVSIPLWFLLVALLSAPVCLLVGAFTGAFIVHRARSGLSPVPQLFASKRDDAEAAKQKPSGLAPLPIVRA